MHCIYSNNSLNFKPKSKYFFHKDPFQKLQKAICLFQHVHGFKGLLQRVNQILISKIFKMVFSFFGFYFLKLNFFKKGLRILNQIII